MSRPHGTGSVYEISDRPGWRAVYTYTDRDTGERKTLSKRFTKKSGATAADAENWLNDQVRAFEGGRRIGAARREDITVREIMRLWWNHKRTSENLQDLTLNDYSGIISKWILPRLGQHHIKNLDRNDMVAWLRWLEVTPAKSGSPMSWQRRRHCYLVLKQAFDYAVGDGYLDISPLVNVPAPRRSADRTVRDVGGFLTPRVRAMGEEDLQKFLQYIANHGCDHSNGNCHARWLMAIALGLRGGEARALRWSNYNARSKELSITHHLQDDPYRHGCGTLQNAATGALSFACGNRYGKSCPQRQGDGLVLMQGTKAGVNVTRAVKISSHLHRVLKEHKEAQRQDKRDAESAFKKRLEHLHLVKEEHLAKGRSTNGVERDIASAKRAYRYGTIRENLSGLIFTSALGREVSKRDDWENFRKVAFAAELSGSYRLHDLRHTAVTLMVNGEASPALVMQVVGHQNLSTTMLYVTPTPAATAVVTERHSDALERLARGR